MPSIPRDVLCDVLLRGEKFEEAIAHLEQCIDQMPEEPIHFFYIGLAFLLLGDELEALNAWAHPLTDESNPINEATYLSSLIRFLVLWAQNYYQLGHFEYSETICWTGLNSLLDSSETNQVYSSTINLYLELGLAQRHQKKFQEAIVTYKYLLELTPDQAEVYYQLGKTLFLKEDYFVAFENFFKAIQYNSSNLSYRQFFAYSLSYIYFSSAGDTLKHEILKCFQEPRIHKNNLVTATLSILKLNPVFQQVLTYAEDSQFSHINRLFQNNQLNTIFDDDLFLFLLKETLVTDDALEKFLICLRTFILHHYLDFDHSNDERLFQVTCAIALQNFNNEYIFYIDQHEIDSLAQLQTHLKKTLSSDTTKASSEQKRNLEWHLAVFGMYYPLLDLERDGMALNETGWSADFDLVFRRVIANYKTEQSLKATIISLTPIENAVSESVQQQYHESPYPRWLNLTCWSPEPLWVEIKTLFPHLTLSLSDLESPLQLLIAGCGTGSEAIQTATRYEGVHVFAVDISWSSLAYAMRMSHQLNVTNIKYRQADILLLSIFNQTFPIIFSTGVLHHLSDPLKGWQILVDLLKPKGIMRIGLYSEIARRHVVQIREQIQAKDISSTPESIRKFRHELSYAEESSLRSVMRYTDFFSMSGCRDLLFHVNEYRFTIPLIKESLRSLGLEFIGFELPSEEIAAKYRHQFPDDPSLQNLDHWHQFEQENPDIFMSMYLFWCQKK